MSKVKKGFERSFVLICCSLIFLFTIYLFLNHVDYFFTRKVADAEIISKEESGKKNGIVFTLNYFNKHVGHLRQVKIKTSYSMNKTIQDQNLKSIKVIYSKWFNQVLIKDYKNPKYAIFIFDFVIFLLMWFGIQYGRKGLINA
jgi:hypothetical protein